MTHTEQGTAAIEQVELLSSLDVDPAHVVLSHTDRVADLAYHRAILQTGVCVEYDSAFRWKQSENPTVELLVALLDEFPHQIMVGMDAARRGYWRAYGGTPGLTYLIESLVPLLKDRGVSTASLQRMFVDNPAAAFSFADCSSKQRTDRTGARS